MRFALPEDEVLTRDAARMRFPGPFPSNDVCVWNRKETKFIAQFRSGELSRQVESDSAQIATNRMRKRDGERSFSGARIAQDCDRCRGIVGSLVDKREPR